MYPPHEILQRFSGGLIEVEITKQNQRKDRKYRGSMNGLALVGDDLQLQLTGTEFLQDNSAGWTPCKIASCKFNLILFRWRTESGQLVLEVDFMGHEIARLTPKDLTS